MCLLQHFQHIVSECPCVGVYVRLHTVQPLLNLLLCLSCTSCQALTCVCGVCFAPQFEEVRNALLPDLLEDLEEMLQEFGVPENATGLSNDSALSAPASAERTCPHVLIACTCRLRIPFGLVDFYACVGFHLYFQRLRCLARTQECGSDPETERLGVGCSS